MARPRLVSDERILTVARDCFKLHGPAVAISCIAKELGVSEAALFKRFGSKDRLMIAALKPPDRPPFLDLLEAGPDDRTLRIQLLEIARAVSGYLTEAVPCISVLRATGMAPADLAGQYEVPPPIRTHEALAAWFRRAKRLGLVVHGSPRSMALAFLGALHLRAFMAHIAGDRFPDVVAATYPRDLVDLYCRGLEDQEAGR